MNPISSNPFDEESQMNEKKTNPFDELCRDGNGINDVNDDVNDDVNNDEYDKDADININDDDSYGISHSESDKEDDSDDSFQSFESESRIHSIIGQDSISTAQQEDSSNPFTCDVKEEGYMKRVAPLSFNFKEVEATPGMILYVLLPCPYLGEYL